MKIKQILILVISFSISFLVSCKKESITEIPSPMINLNIWNKLGKTGNYDYFMFHGARNNVTSISTAHYSNGVLSAITLGLDNSDIYTFKANGYPSSLQFQFPMKLLYTYKTL